MWQGYVYVNDVRYSNIFTFAVGIFFVNASRFAPTSFMPTAKKTSSARSLAPPFQTATAGAGLRFGFLNAHGHLVYQHNPG